jgi:hypothetical protein
MEDVDEVWMENVRGVPQSYRFSVCVVLEGRHDVELNVHVVRG